MKPTMLKDIARLTGVSVSTVSRVVRNQDNVKPKTRERVLEALETYNYVPNQMARNLKLQRSNAVGVIVPDITDPFFSNIITSMEKTLTHADYTMLLGISDENPHKEDRYIEYMMRNKVDGLVIATVSSDPTMINRFIGDGRALVFIDNLPRLTNVFSAVLTDNAQASEQAVEHLYALGHKNIAIIAGKQDETTGRERLRGYREAMEMRSLPIRDAWVRTGDFKGMSGYENMKLLLEECPEITAVYVNSAQMTYGAYKALLDTGRRVPRDISIIGFDIQNNTGMLESDITSIIQQDTEIGRIASETLLRLVTKDSDLPMQKIYLNASVRPRQSTGAPR